jgi:Terminase RNaseH-like domain
LACGKYFRSSSFGEQHRYPAGEQSWLNRLQRGLASLEGAGEALLGSAEAKVRLLAGFNVRTERVTGDKEVRAEPYAAQAEAGNVRLLRSRWNAAYLDELTAFPNGTYQDQVDASSGAFNKLAKPKRQIWVGVPR